MGATSLGLLIATVGMESQSAVTRFTFGSNALIDGIPFIIAATGLFGISEVMVQLNVSRSGIKRLAISNGPWISWSEIRRVIPAAIRGSGLGFLVGMMPGAGGVAATFLSYNVERSISKNPDQFGKGAIEGLAGPEAANNASAQGSLIPLFTLGIPGSATGAILLGAFLMFGLQPGPLLMANSPQIAWTIIASMIVGNMLLLVLNFPMVPLFAKILDVPKNILYGAILVFIATSVFSVRGELLDLILLAGFGAGGYILRKCFPSAPMAQI